MKLLSQFMARRQTLFGLGLALILLIAAAVFITSRASPAPSDDPYTLTPRPRDVGASLITHEAFPSLSYGIQAFLWWNGSTRERDLEHIRQMRFNYVKQIFGW